MSGSSWELVIPVLLAGLALGAGWVVLARRRGQPEAASHQRDRALRIADLEAQQELLYAQLREVDAAERDELELAAARNLKALEEAAGGPMAGARASASVTAPDGRESPVEVRPRSSAVVGFVGGAACAALVGLLLVWAQRDAQPKPGEGAASRPMAADERHPDGAQLSEDEAEAIERIARHVEDDPTDIMARKQYAVALLSTGQFVGAFEQAEILLASDGGDPDGLYVKGMVRMRMGQEAEARALFERLVVDYPEHVPALTALGVLVLRSGGLEAAEAYWDQAVLASGGENEEVEQLRVAARRQMAEGAASLESAPEPRQPPVVAARPEGYVLQIDLAPGTSLRAGGMLFVSLRQGDAGPPAAVRRIVDPIFPLTVILSSADSMMGQPLPADGTISVRWDADGNVSTRSDGEPEALVTMAVGQTANLTLQ